MLQKQHKKYMDANNKLKLILLDSLVVSALTYSLPILPLSNNHLSKLQSFHSNCVRYLLTKRFSELEHKPHSNHYLRDKFNIPTIESKILQLRFRMYARWKNTFSIAYLNNSPFINEQINLLNNTIREYQEISGNILIRTEI